MVTFLRCWLRTMFWTQSESSWLAGSLWRRLWVTQHPYIVILSITLSHINFTVFHVFLSQLLIEDHVLDSIREQLNQHQRMDGALCNNVRLIYSPTIFYCLYNIKCIFFRFWLRTMCWTQYENSWTSISLWMGLYKTQWDSITALKCFIVCSILSWSFQVLIENHILDSIREQLNIHQPMDGAALYCSIVYSISVLLHFMRWLLLPGVDWKPCVGLNT